MFEQKKNLIICPDTERRLVFDVWQEFIGKWKKSENDRKNYKSGFCIFLNLESIFKFKHLYSLKNHKILPVCFDGINCFGVKAVYDKNKQIKIIDIVVTSERFVPKKYFKFILRYFFNLTTK